MLVKKKGFSPQRAQKLFDRYKGKNPQSTVGLTDFSAFLSAFHPDRSNKQIRIEAGKTTGRTLHGATAKRILETTGLRTKAEASRVAAKVRLADFAVETMLGGSIRKVVEAGLRDPTKSMEDIAKEAGLARSTITKYNNKHRIRQNTKSIGTRAGRLKQIAHKRAVAKALLEKKTPEGNYRYRISDVERMTGVGRDLIRTVSHELRGKEASSAMRSTAKLGPGIRRREFLRKALALSFEPRKEIIARAILREGRMTLKVPRADAIYQTYVDVRQEHRELRKPRFRTDKTKAQIVRSFFWKEPKRSLKKTDFAKIARQLKMPIRFIRPIYAEQQQVYAEQEYRKGYLDILQIQEKTGLPQKQIDQIQAHVDAEYERGFATIGKGK